MSRPVPSILPRLLGAFALLALFLTPLATWADEYEQVTGSTQPRTDPNPFILAAYGVIWAVVMIYVVVLARGLGRTRNEIEALRHRVDRTVGK